MLSSVSVFVGRASGCHAQFCFSVRWPCVWLSCSILFQCSLAVRLAVMLSSAYAVNLILRRIPLTLEQRHTKRRQCLCQFIEEFLTAYLSCVRQHETSTSNLQYIFRHYMNSQFRPDTTVLQALGISVIESA